MVQKKEKTVQELLQDQLKLQQDQLITMLGLAGVSQHQIRAIVGVDIHRVSRVVKLLKKKEK